MAGPWEHSDRDTVFELWWFGWFVLVLGVGLFGFFLRRNLHGKLLEGCTPVGRLLQDTCRHSLFFFPCPPFLSIPAWPPAEIRYGECNSNEAKSTANLQSTMLLEEKETCLKACSSKKHF